MYLSADGGLKPANSNFSRFALAATGKMDRQGQVGGGLCQSPLAKGHKEHTYSRTNCLIYSQGKHRAQETVGCLSERVLERTRHRTWAAPVMHSDKSQKQSPPQWQNSKTWCYCCSLPLSLSDMLGSGMRRGLGVSSTRAVQRGRRTGHRGKQPLPRLLRHGREGSRGLSTQTLASPAVPLQAGASRLTLRRQRAREPRRGVHIDWSREGKKPVRGRANRTASAARQPRAHGRWHVKAIP